MPPCGIQNCEGEIYGTDFVRVDDDLDLDGYGTVTIDGWCEIEAICEMSDKLPTNTMSLTYAPANIAVGIESLGNGNSRLSFTMVDLGDGITPFVTMTVPDSSLNIPDLTTEFQNDLAVYNVDYTYVNIPTIAVNALTPTSALLSFDYRSGNPYISCEQNACGVLPNYDQQWLVGGPAWTALA